jgi:hypothetical protein
MATYYTSDLVSFIRDFVPMEGSYGPQALIPSHLPRGCIGALTRWTSRNACYRQRPEARQVSDGGGVALFMATRQRYAEVVIAAADQIRQRIGYCAL